MKTAILCGGRGTRLGEHGKSLPKALIEIGGKPVLWHILKLYTFYGLNDFVLCLGYLGNEIKRHFIEQRWLTDDFKFDLKKNDLTFLTESTLEKWEITFADTGLDTNTGGRLLKINHYLSDEDTFCVTYGDGLANINIGKLIDFHKSHGKIATLTSVNPQSSFGLIKINEGNLVTEFQEKPQLQDWINGGFFVFNRKIFDYLDENSVLEQTPFEQLARDQQLAAYKHRGFWKCMDTYKDNIEFNDLWFENKALWKVW